MQLYKNTAGDSLHTQSLTGFLRWLGFAASLLGELFFGALLYEADSREGFVFTALFALALIAANLHCSFGGDNLLFDRGRDLVEAWWGPRLFVERIKLSSVKQVQLNLRDFTGAKSSQMVELSASLVGDGVSLRLFTESAGRSWASELFYTRRETAEAFSRFLGVPLYVVGKSKHIRLKE